MKKIELNVKGMSCTGCENRIKNAVSSIDGVVDVTANFKTGVVTVDLDDKIDENTISERIEDIGFEVEK